MLNVITKNGGMLALFAIVTTALVSLTFTGTKDTIEHQEQMRLKAVLGEVVPASQYDSVLYENCVIVTHPLLGNDEPHNIYRAYKGDNVSAFVLEATAPDGYSGDIDVVIGASPSLEVFGVRVVSHKETPGLGDKVEPRISDWIYSFNGRDFDSERASVWQVKKDGGVFDQFTGATITPRAVVGAVRNALTYLQTHRDELTDAANACGLSEGLTP